MYSLKDIMTRDVTVVSPDATIQDVARLMKQNDTGFLPVCHNDRLIGTITDRDIVVRGLVDRFDGSSLRVSDVMSRDVAWCYEDQDVREAASMMREKQIRRLIILDRNKRLCGVVSVGDLAVETGKDRLSGEVLSDISRPNHPASYMRHMEKNSGSFLSTFFVGLAGIGLGYYAYQNRDRLWSQVRDSIPSDWKEQIQGLRTRMMSSSDDSMTASPTPSVSDQNAGTTMGTGTSLGSGTGTSGRV